MELGSIRGKTVVITGGTAGVGRAAARMFADRGASVAVLARGQERIEQTVDEIHRRGQRGVGYSVDVADSDAVDSACSDIESTLGPIDIWVNNAMASVFSPVNETTPEEFARVTDVTYLGTVYGTLAALKRMRERDRGKIIFVGSALAYRGIPLQAPYCAAKHAVQGFVDSLRCELLHDNSGIDITMIQLPAVNTPQFEWVKSRLPNRGQPVPPIFQPEIAAQAIIWSATHKQRELMVGYSSIRAIIGNKIAPSYADHVLAEQGYDLQQTDEPEDPDRPHNLWEPVEGDYQARGRFSHRSTSFSPALWLLTSGRSYLLGAAAIGAGILASRLLPSGQRSTATN